MSLFCSLDQTGFIFYDMKPQKQLIDEVFSRVLRDSTPRFVRRSVGRLVGRSVGPHFTFFICFTFLTSPLLPKWSSDLKYGPCPPARPLPTRTRLRQPCIRPCFQIILQIMFVCIISRPESWQMHKLAIGK